MLRVLKKDHILAVATNKEVTNSAKLLEHFGLDGYFDSIKGHNNVKGYMKADMIRELLNEFELQPQDALLVGDSIHDANSASQTGIDFMPLTSGFGFSDMASLEGVRYIQVLNCMSDMLKHPDLL